MSTPRYDWGVAPDGLHAECLSPDPGALFEIATSPAWAALRPLFRRPGFCNNLGRALRASLSAKADTADILSRLRAEALLSSAFAAPASPESPAPRPAAPPTHGSLPLLLPSPWQLVTQTVLATRLPDVRIDATVTLELRALTLSAGPESPPVPLRRAEALLLSLLIIAGEAGLTARDVKQLVRDLDQLDTDLDRAWLLGWSAQCAENDALDRARQNRIDVLKHRTNQALGPFGLEIVVTRGSGIWHIVSSAPGAPPIRLRGTLWDFVFPKHPKAPGAPPDSTPQQAVLWRALAAAAPACLCLPQLAQILDKPSDVRGLKQTLDALRKLNTRLMLAHSPVRIRRVRRGQYALIPSAGDIP